MAHLHLPITAFVLALSITEGLPAGAVPEEAAPRTPGIYVSGQMLAEQLKASSMSSADPALAEVGVTNQYAIHEVQRARAGPAAMHVGWMEIHLILQGSGTLVTGGKMVTTAAGGATIEGGVSHTLKKGDVFIIPANTPHMYKDIGAKLTYFEVRFVSTPPGDAAK